MLQHVLVVLDGADNDVPGEVTVYKDETVWGFRPQQPWQAGQYYLSVDTALEDRAGNSIGRPFEVDMFRTVERVVTPKLIKLPFEVQ